MPARHERLCRTGYGEPPEETDGPRDVEDQDGEENTSLASYVEGGKAD